MDTPQTDTSQSLAVTSAITELQTPFEHIYKIVGHEEEEAKAMAVESVDRITKMAIAYLISDMPKSKLDELNQHLPEYTTPAEQIRYVLTFSSGQAIDAAMFQASNDYMDSYFQTVVPSLSEEQNTLIQKEFDAIMQKQN